jgi:hypothetical protein
MTNKELLEIFENCDFYNLGMDEDGNDSWIIDKIINNLAIPNTYEFDFNYGASKLVIKIWDKPNKTDINIIKIPFQGVYCYEYDRNTEEEKEEFTKYHCSRTLNGWDYCEKEVETYSLAEKAGVDYYFAKTELIGYVHSYPIYKQQYVEETNAYEREDYSEQEAKITAKACQDKKFHSINSIWLSNAVAIYGTQSLIKLIDFIKDNSIYDLHESNIGYHEKKPIIFDYSDFND